MLFGLRTRVAKGTMYYLDIYTLHGKGQFSGGGKGWPIVMYRDTVVSCAKTADPMENGDAVWDA